MSNDTKNPEEMSLAELLGGGTPLEPDQSTPDEAPVDEAGSGMINLAQMVMTANKPKPAPVQAAPAPADTFGAQQSAWGTAAPDAAMGGAPVMSPTAAQKKPPMALFIGIGVAALLVVGVVVALLVNSTKGDASRDAELQALQAQLAIALEKAKASGDEEEIARLQAKVDASAAGEMVEPETMDFSDGDDDEDGDDDDDDDPDPAKPRRAGRRPGKAATKTAATTTTPTAATPKAETPAAATPKADAPKAADASKKGNTSELDSLLSGGTKAPAPSAGLPAKPSKAQVASAMAPVASKSQSTCKQWGTGRVSIRVVVGGNGRVRDAVPQGEHAASPLGRCVSKVALTASFPPFTDPTLTFTYPININ